MTERFGTIRTTVCWRFNVPINNDVPVVHSMLVIR